MPPPTFARSDDKLRRLAEAGPLPTLVILPSLTREEGAFYSDLDIEAKKLLRAAGIDADYLDPPGQRRLLGEHSSGFLLALAVSTLAELGAEGAIAVAKYALLMLRRAVQRGLVQEPAAASLTIDIRRLRRHDGALEIEGLHVEARGDRVVEQVIAVLAPSLDPATTAAELRQEIERGEEG